MTNMKSIQLNNPDEVLNAHFNYFFIYIFISTEINTAQFCIMVSGVLHRFSTSHLAPLINQDQTV